ncbi:MAG: Tex family protein [Firmicutes bacterium]|nr:Tex family protein [Bacillota bacterium]
MDYAVILAKQFNVQPGQVQNVISLLDEGNTVPFIARYRKEAHGSLDDQTIRELSEKLAYLRGLDARREEVRGQIEALGAMTDEISASLENAQTLAEIEDIYRPYRPKRRTRASVAKERGLQPLADAIFAQERRCDDPLTMAQAYVDEEKQVPTAQDALAGAMDIIAEAVSDNPSVRKRLRVVAAAQGKIVACAAKEEDSVYAQYYDYSEPVAKMAGHRVLALDRGEREEFLKVSLDFDENKALSIIESEVVRENSPCTQTVRDAARDAYERLIFPSLEREIRSALTEQADEQAIHVFAMNLKDLLMQPPVKGKTVLALDPGYAHGCKVAVVNPTGSVLDTGVIYPVPPRSKIVEAKAILKRMIEKNGVEVIAIGNGTASRETEIFTAELIRETGLPLSYMVVSEAGASVYSASKLAVSELPMFDVNIRSAVSIARRMQDPLAELVKIDPQAIGVGQYQHDMPKKQLDEALGGVVENCVNRVGVDLNTASPALLSHIAGVNDTIAKNIVAYREENGGFSSRAELKKVPRLGPKAFEQCAGFLRVPESKNPLDNTAVHPESYAAAGQLLELCGYTDRDVRSGGLSGLPEKLAALGEEETAKRLGIGVPTLQDIVAELMKPGRDPRDELPPPLLRTDVLSMEDLKPGMELDGTVRNVADFGAFVDIGVHQDGLVHISQLCDRFIRHPSEAVKIGDVVRVRVLAVDAVKKRISLTMRLDKGKEDKTAEKNRTGAAR